MSPGRWDHSGAAHWTTLDCRRPAPARDPGIFHSDNRAFGESGAMTDATIIAEWPINRRESVRISVEQYKGVDLVNIRKWFKAEDGSSRPGKAEIALNVKHLPQLAEAMTKALSIAATGDGCSQPK
jgi:Transcriptional Coactivator p15 (PC4)